ncbi:MAG TPA: TlpA disulfide reductase family protein [Arachidicoccus soli]|uniref:TlpA family protein disulfide reductase n=1 Tax=Arachidicoccus soli TaxID=2341117 RepID=A0A386HLH0_9BACT|nr:TlpA disulfide reductase family protein [Arachidicoccus soli]AYD46748.1 TlpA family protein disulfide reductase [Arachidicoccus soli]HEU0226274.1 TlpA disulfide reductase family protein [Arachidicoccus soli]
MKKNFLLILALLFSIILSAQEPSHSRLWRAIIHRPDGKQIVFNIASTEENGAPVIYILNAKERMRVPNVILTQDSIFIKMPVFESGFKAKIISADSINGVWTRASVGKNIVLPFTATSNDAIRFPAKYGNAKHNISGKWAMQFPSPAIGEFTQQGNRITGSVLTPTGDDRYLEGIVSGDSVWLSGFDGIHSLLYEAKINGDHLNGKLYSGATSMESFTAVKNDTASLPNSAAMYIRTGESGHLNFSFKNLDGKLISINNPQFKNKVVVIDIMGSWCPNCMDETAFLSDFYNKNKQRGIAMIGLCYELTTDFTRSRNSIMKFKDRFNVEYPLLITGVSVADPLRTEKTLPQLTPIKMFPTTIILDKTGKVRKIDTGFEGPATGEYYTEYVKEFNEYIDKLLKE